MNYKEFINKLIQCKMLNPINEALLDFIYNQIDNLEKEQIIQILAIYFSLEIDGNTCISLDKELLINKWKLKCNETKILLEDDDEIKKCFIDEISSYSIELINKYLSLINENELSSIVGKKSLFVIDNNYLFTRKNYFAKEGIKNSIQRLFIKKEISSIFDYKEWIDNSSNFKLSKNQEIAIQKGINSNLIITGGPGTGKTTTIFYILLGILSKNKDYHIYLTAPSGKASSRMKESILGAIKNINASKINDDKIKMLLLSEEYTIHRLLGYGFNDDGFTTNNKPCFKKNSIFIIDEASMIDICLFDSLLKAIPSEARIFILGDKNQLPSVDSGMVLNDLLNEKSLENNIVELDESIRFKNNTKIYELSQAINLGKELPIKEDEWKNLEDFKIEKDDDINKPIFYYKNDIEKVAEESKLLEHIIKKWGDNFYSKVVNGEKTTLQKEAMNIDINDKNKLNYLFSKIELAKILCAEKRSIRGVDHLNKLINDLIIDKSLIMSLSNHYTGEIVMINKNNKLLNLYNGDTGIIVSFKNDDTLYFMVKKSLKEIEVEEYKKDTIFKLGEYIFYPLRMINEDEIDYAYAITIHKSQGSDYKNILVILPNKKGHPLLNRQIVYTAITRTKGNTYIISTMERLNEAKNKVTIRDTRIFK